MVDLKEILVSCDSFCVREVGEETIFLTEKGDELHSLNDVGTFIWKAIDGYRSQGDILDRIFDEYKVSREAAEKDFIQFINELVKKGIVKLKRKQS